MVTAARRRTVPTAKVVLMPVATACGVLVLDEARAKTFPMTDAPVMSPRKREKFRIPEMTPDSSGPLFVIAAVLLAARKSE